VELEQQRGKFAAQGLGIVAISYDPPALMKDFASRKGITYPLLGDGESAMIRSFGILNGNFPPEHEWYGVPFPGTYIVNEKGVVLSKFFEDDHRERYTASTVLLRTGASTVDGWQEAETKHLKLRYGATESTVRPGNLVALAVEVELKPGMHVYAPGVQSSYIPIDWKMPNSTSWLARPAQYPAARTLHPPAIQESVPVYENRFRLTRELLVGQSGEIRPALGPDNKLKVEGSLRYQACDDKICYAPVTVPLEWSFATERHDGQRAPAELRRKPAR